MSNPIDTGKKDFHLISCPSVTYVTWVLFACFLIISSDKYVERTIWIFIEIMRSFVEL